MNFIKVTLVSDDVSWELKFMWVKLNCKGNLINHAVKSFMKKIKICLSFIVQLNSMWIQGNLQIKLTKPYTNCPWKFPIKCDDEYKRKTIFWNILQFHIFNIQMTIKLTKMHILIILVKMLWVLYNSLCYNIETPAGLTASLWHLLTGTLTSPGVNALTHVGTRTHATGKYVLQR